jgi:hypothetical protein
VDHVVRLLVFLLGMLTAGRPGRQEPAWNGAGYPGAGAAAAAVGADTFRPVNGTDGQGRTAPLPPWPPLPGGGDGPPGPGGPRWDPRPRRRQIRRLVTWSAVLLVLGLIFRRAIASVVLMALSAALHLVGLNVHLPSVKFAWPWQTIAAGTTTNTDLGPWVLQKIEGISKPALGQASFSFYFTHKVSKNIGPWPCWYQSTFYAVGHASATVDLNPGASWWKPSTGHYELQVLSRPGHGDPGHVAVSMVLPAPQLPRSAHDVTIDNIPSRPIDTQHSWTYPGLGCGLVLRPQFAQAVLYSQAQYIAFYKATHLPQVTAPLVRAAENQASLTIRNNFVQPTVNAFGYMLDRFTVRWAGSLPPAGTTQGKARR